MSVKYGFLVFLSLILALSASTVRGEAVLTITDAKISPKFPTPGGQVTVSITIKNIGNEPVSARTSLGVEIYPSTASGQRVSGDSIPLIPWYTNNIEALAPNRTQLISATTVIQKAGYHTAFAVIVNETVPLEKLRIENGSRNMIFEVGRSSDLVLGSARLNHKGRLVLSMYNAGNKIPADQFQNSEISVRAGGKHVKILLRNAAPQTLRNAGKSGVLGFPTRHTFVWPSTGAAGLYLDPAIENKVEITLDYNQMINDGRRSNNTKKEKLGGGPDLVVCFKKNNHNKPNRNAYYPPYVKNIGYAPSGPSKLRFWIENDGVRTYSVPALPAGASYRGVQRRVYWVRVKNHKFRLTVDNNSNVDEFDEYNNIIEGYIIVGKYGNNSATLCSNEPGMKGFN